MELDILDELKDIGVFEKPEPKVRTALKRPLPIEQDDDDLPEAQAEALPSSLQEKLRPIIAQLQAVTASLEALCEEAPQEEEEVAEDAWEFDPLPQTVKAKVGDTRESEALVVASDAEDAEDYEEARARARAKIRGDVREGKLAKKMSRLMGDEDEDSLPFVGSFAGLKEQEEVSVGTLGARKAPKFNGSGA